MRGVCLELYRLPKTGQVLADYRLAHHNHNRWKEFSGSIAVSKHKSHPVIDIPIFNALKGHLHHYGLRALQCTVTSHQLEGLPRLHAPKIPATAFQSSSMQTDTASWHRV